jgi:hypothetical protein
MEAAHAHERRSGPDVPMPPGGRAAGPMPVAVVEKASRPMLTAVLSLLIAFFPKCPVCWATYMSMFGSVWLARTP